jgi:hypothetical protein
VCRATCRTVVLSRTVHPHEFGHPAPLGIFATNPSQRTYRQPRFATPFIGPTYSFAPARFWVETEHRGYQDGTERRNEPTERDLMPSQTQRRVGASANLCTRVGRGRHCASASNCAPPRPSVWAIDRSTSDRRRSNVSRRALTIPRQAHARICVWLQQVVRRLLQRNTKCYRYRMPTTPLRFRIPAQCKLCGALGTVVPETTITGSVVRMTWCCRACQGEWPITRGEQQLIERRSNISDRRRIPRKDRRTD